ncbi:MAG: homoserine dehydrogenase, partial [Lachnospiraceae bacterium]|nr:homoserine dehydrogenase [Lachnospiraceae bacterium]
TLTGIEEASRKFFVRVAADKEKEAIAAFEGMAVVNANVPGEFAFVTDVMTEKEFNKKAEKVGIISRIRVEA